MPPPWARRVKLGGHPRLRSAVICRISSPPLPRTSVCANQASGTLPPHLARTPMKTAWGWSAKLTRALVLKDGTRLATLADVRALILNEPKHIKERGSWQHAAELMILAAERGGSIEAA